MILECPGTWNLALWVLAALAKYTNMEHDKFEWEKTNRIRVHTATWWREAGVARSEGCSGTPMSLWPPRTCRGGVNSTEPPRRSDRTRPGRQE